MSLLTREKLDAAVQLVQRSGADVWLTFVRETAEGGDPILPLIVEGGLTWHSALLVAASGSRVAIVGSYDADPLRASGDWHEVIGYVQSIREPLLESLEALVPVFNGSPKIAVNFSVNDVKADGLSHGMFVTLENYLAGSRFEGALVSSEEIVMSLRGQKSATELAAIEGAIVQTDRLFDDIAGFATVGKSEREVYRFVHELIGERGLGFGWDPVGDPIVNSGPDSMIGHGIPSDKVTLTPGHIFHIDLGVIENGYSSDIQRCWYVAAPNETEPPSDVMQALDVVNRALSAAASRLRPGALGWEVDLAARTVIVESGYDEYMHAVGHQVGRVAHDGGAILGPRWERYGRTPVIPIKEDEVYTLELGVNVPGRGYLGIEEMVVVTSSGCRWLSNRQTTMPVLH